MHTGSASSGAPALWQQLRAAAWVVQAVRGGSSATAALDTTAASLRPAAQALAYHALRNLGRATALRRLLAPRAPPPAADALLCTALALCSADGPPPYPAFTLVDQTVEAAKRHTDSRPQASFINACLRRFLRERDALLAGLRSDAVAEWSHPDWWIQRLRADHPQQWQSILRTARTPAPLVLRVNPRRASVAQVCAAFAAAGVAAQPVGAQGVQVLQARPVTSLPGFDQGHFSVQDAAAQLAAPLLLTGLPQPLQGRLRVLDACAAPGGKTAHVLELCDADLLALDIDAARCQRLHDNLHRLGLQAQVQPGDASEPAAWWDGRAFDAILLDAPCTASGIVRRHPDIPWLRRASDVAALAQRQADLLRALWPLLAAGGRLLYCTCSVFHAEGQAVVQAFVAHNKDAFLLASPGHLIPQSSANCVTVLENGSGDHDGFYYALLRKQPVA